MNTLELPERELSPPEKWYDEAADKALELDAWRAERREELRDPKTLVDALHDWSDYGDALEKMIAPFLAASRATNPIECAVKRHDAAVAAIEQLINAVLDAEQECL